MHTYSHSRLNDDNGDDDVALDTISHILNPSDSGLVKITSIFSDLLLHVDYNAITNATGQIFPTRKRMSLKILYLLT